MAAIPQHLTVDPEPDLHPLYPTKHQIKESLSLNSGFDPVQKSEFVTHCLKRACLFADLSILQCLMADPVAQAYIDLGVQDEDGVGLVSLTIHGFGGDLDRDVEREECVRYLVSQGADLNADKAGWTPLHHAAVIAPPTLVSYLMTHGCSPFEVTGRNLTPLDIVTAHSVIPDREDVALLLEEAMRGHGWTGGRVEQRRRLYERKERRKGKRKAVKQDASNVLGIQPKWGHYADEDSDSDSEEEDYGAPEDSSVYTPSLDYSSMLVFSPSTLPQIFDAVITNFPVALKDPTPAQTLYFLARFACLTCDHIWLEDLIMGATDAIEDAFFNNADDLPTLVFWLYNTALWMHLMQCDKSIRPALEMLGCFELVEEVINSVFVFIIRFAERKIDQLLDAALLDYAPSGSESETVEFESEWSFLRPFAKKKAPPPVSTGTPRGRSHTMSSPTPSVKGLHVSSASLGGGYSPLTPKFSSLKQSLARAQAVSAGSNRPVLPAPPNGPSPYELTTFFTALHTLLAFADVNPLFTTQLWSQVFYWTSCEIFNRVITRKKYLCRSRAHQIQANLGVIEEWVDELGLPPGIQAHFAPVKDLLKWLQWLTSVSEFTELVAVIQSLKHLNPLQMRRAIRDYRYEVDELKMTDECIQYIIQLQKDWERHRVKLGVEILRKEISERDRERAEDCASTHASESADDHDSIGSDCDTDINQRSGIDILLDRNQDKSWWQPIRAPQALGELLDSRYMLPLLFPDEPRLLAALPSRTFLEGSSSNTQPVATPLSPSFPSSAKPRSLDLGGPSPLLWRSRDRRIRETSVHLLKVVDGTHSDSQWWKNFQLPFDMEDRDHHEQHQEHRGLHVDDSLEMESPIEDEERAGLGQGLQNEPDLTPIPRKPSGRVKGRTSTGMGDVTPIDGTFNIRPPTRHPSHGPT